MIKINKPEFKAEDVFITCISATRDVELKNRLSDCKSLIIEAAQEFDEKVTNGKIHTIKIEKGLDINGNVKAKELEKVYTNSMVRQDAPGRKYYDKLILSSPNGICPLCAQNRVKSLDHYLPKTEFPRLAISPVNLIPSCSDCNKTKMASFPKAPEEETLHPYYDDIENDVWLKARVRQSNPPTIDFYVSPPSAWPNLLKTRLEHHFCTFDLNRLYSIHTATPLASLSHRLNPVFKDLGFDGVKYFLKEEALSNYKVSKNSWQTAFHQALAEDDWYCNGGFHIK